MIIAPTKVALNDIIYLIDPMTEITIWLDDDDITPLFKGRSEDFPHLLWEKNYKLAKGLEDGECAISCRLHSSRNDAILVLAVTDKE